MLTTHTTLANIKALLDDKSVYGYENKEYSRTGNTTNTSDVIDSVDIDNLVVGDYVNGTGIVTDSTILSIGATSITISNNCTVTATGVSITITHYSLTDFETDIESQYKEVEFMEMYPVISETIYDYINDDISDLSDYHSYRMVVYAERYFIASYFLDSIANKEIQGRLTMKEFKSVDGITTGMSGEAGKTHLANQYKRKANAFLRKAGYNKTDIKVF